MNSSKVTTARPRGADDELLPKLEQLLGERLPTAVVQAREAFRRDLPRLLAEHPRQWVAYNGEDCLGIGRSKTALHQECVERGFSPEHFLVLSIEPESSPETELPLDV